MSLLTLEEGSYLVKLARRTIENYFMSKSFPEVKEEDLTPNLKEKRGVFTTLYKIHPEKELRGCIGYPYPIKELYEAIMETAIEAAFNDPRFSPLEFEELKEVIIEVSILTPPERINVQNPLEYPKLIKIGRDGLIIKYGVYSGLLLPQVPVEYGWDSEEFLAHLSMKAGLPPDAWLWKGVEIYRFAAQIFTELSPGGEIREERLK